MSLEFVDRARPHSKRTALSDRAGEYTYSQLETASARAAATLMEGRDDLAAARVAFMVEPSFDYVRLLWGIWRAGGVAVPLCLSHPGPELAHVLDDSRPIATIAGPGYEELLRTLAVERGIPCLAIGELDRRSNALPDIPPERPALMLYTSGTTGRPKGVVVTHRNLVAQITSLIDAWGWDSDDRILQTLPLHHIHGIVNVVSCALWAGARCEMLAPFDAGLTWARLASREVTLYKAVPTIYHRLFRAWEEADPEQQQCWSEGCRRLRLMVSGSAALPVTVLKRWRQITGHTLLERYGMTEIGMALSNPLVGERLPGQVGTVLPGVEARLVDENDQAVADGTVGQIQIRGDGVFSEYWNRPEATAAAFTPDRWFRTGDVGIRHDRVYRFWAGTRSTSSRLAGKRCRLLRSRRSSSITRT